MFGMPHCDQGPLRADSVSTRPRRENASQPAWLAGQRMLTASDEPQRIFVWSSFTSMSTSEDCCNDGNVLSEFKPVSSLPLHDKRAARVVSPSGGKPSAWSSSHLAGALDPQPTHAAAAGVTQLL